MQKTTAMARPKSKKKKFTRDDLDLTLISLPTFIWFVLFSYLPMFGIIIAFKEYKLSGRHGFLYSLFHATIHCPIRPGS